MILSIVSLTLIASLVCTIPASGQTSSAPSQTGFQPNRDYLAFQPFEAIDTAAGNLILRFEDLVLPGNAGFNLRVERAYNAYTRRWGFGISGVPLRVVQPTIPTNVAIMDTVQENQRLAPRFVMPDSTEIKTTFTQVPDVSAPSTLQWSSSPQFWKYHRGGTLYLPDGRIAQYDETGRLANVHDPFDNWLFVSYGTGTLLVSQSLSNGESRRVQFDMDFTLWLPKKMTYEGREWKYEYDANVAGNLRFVRLPVGGSWEFTYTAPQYTTLVSRVTTPFGGKIDYNYGYQTFQTGPNPAVDQEQVFVLGSRDVSGPDLPSGHWEFKYNVTTGGVVSGMVVELPSGFSVAYTYASQVGSSNDFAVAGEWALIIVGLYAPAQTSGPPIEQVDLTYTPLRADRRWVVPEVWYRSTTRAGKTYTTQHVYDADVSTLHHYHRPLQVVETGATGELSRTTELTYQPVVAPPDLSSPYLVGLVTQETVKVGTDTVVRSWHYRADGFKDAETIYGITTTYTSQPGDYGNVTTATKNGNTTTFKYRFGQVSEIQTPKHTTTRAINPDGTIKSDTQGGRTTTYEYDALGRVTKVDPPGDDTLATTTDYTRITKIVTRRGSSITETALDSLGRPIETENAVHTRTRTAYDAEGRTIFASLPFGETEADPPGLRTCYDGLGRAIREAHVRQSEVPTACGAAVAARTRTYDDSAHTVTVSDEEGRRTVLTYRGFGHPDDARLTTVVDARNQSWTYEYNALGALTRVVAPGGVERKWEYTDPARPTQLIRETHPESGTVVYSLYDAGGLLRRKTDAKGVEFVYDYDGNERLTSITAGTSQTTITYEAGTDRRWDVTRDGITTEFRYDDAGRLGSRRDVVDGKAFQTTFDYDGKDNLRTVTYPTGRQVAYTYNAENQILQVTKGQTTQAYVQDFTYHPSGAVSSYRASNGLVTTLCYDPLRYWVTLIRNTSASVSCNDTAPAGPLFLAYGNYDKVGNVRSITDWRSDRHQTFTYDALDRLLTATGTGWYGPITMAYDAHGNAQLPNLTYEPANPFRLKTVGGAQVTYDANGSLATGPNVTYTYAPGNRLASVTAGTTTTQYKYDADDWRLKKDVQGGEVHYYVRGPNGALLEDWWNNRPDGKAEVRDYIYAGSRLIAVVKTTQDPK